MIPPGIVHNSPTVHAAVRYFVVMLIWMFLSLPLALKTLIKASERPAVASRCVPPLKVRLA